MPAGGYVDLLLADDYLTAEQPTKDRKYRVRNNAFGTVDFSPVLRLWRYVRVEETPHVTAHPGSRAYRFFDASKEAVFLHRMIRQAVEEEIPCELAGLSGYDKAFE